MYVKKEKFYFDQEEIVFLGHWVNKWLLHVDDAKVNAVVKTN